MRSNAWQSARSVQSAMHAAMTGSYAAASASRSASETCIDHPSGVTACPSAPVYAGPRQHPGVGPAYVSGGGGGDGGGDTGAQIRNPIHSLRPSL